MKILKFIYLFFLIFLLIYILYFWYNIIHLSILSLKVSCNDISDEELNKLGYFVAGEYYSCNDSINIYLNETSFNKKEIVSINKHENCHRFQEYNNYSYGCSERFNALLNEIECYFSEKIPDKIYNEKFN